MSLLERLIRAGHPLSLALFSSLIALSPAQASPTSPPVRTRVTIFLLPAKGFADKDVGRISNRLLKALRKNPRLKVKDWDKLLVEFSGEVPTETLAQAETAQKAGRELLDAGRAAEAAVKLQESITLMKQALAFVKKQQLAATTMALGIAQARAGKRRQATRTLMRLLLWRPMLRYDNALGPKHIALFERARAASKRRKRGSIELTSEPPGAKAYVDGRFMGVTPTVAFGLRVGTHFATLKKAGYIKAARAVKVSPNRQQAYQIDLRRSEKYLLLQQTLRRAVSGLGKTKANDAMSDLRSFLFVDQVVFATLGYAGPDKLDVQAFLYDLRSKLRLNQTSKVIPRRGKKPLSGLARMLYLNVRYDGMLEAPPEPPPPPPETRRAFYATWWFWTAVAAGTAAVSLTAAFWPSDKGCQALAGPSQRCVLFRN